MAKKFLISEATAKNIKRIERKVDTLSGIGVLNTLDTIVINPPEQARRDRSRPNAAIIGQTFRVNLSSTGGSAGSKTTAVSFVYTVTSLGGEELGTSKAPEWPSRSENGLKVAATKGLAYYDTSGTLQLAIAFERAGTGACP